MLKNITAEELAAFRHSIELVDLIGEERTTRIAGQIEDCAKRNPGRAPGMALRSMVEPIVVAEPEPLVLDPAGYFVVHPERRREVLVLEHYTTKGVLDAVLEGRTAGALYQGVISRGLVSRLDHAAYLGRELARAEQSLRDGSAYVQDRAPEPEQVPGSIVSSCGCSGGSCQ